VEVEVEVILRGWLCSEVCGMGDSSPKVIHLHFSVCCWLGGAVAASGSFAGCIAVVVGFLISVRISFIMH
jgi:hypothetical protein